jgi:hypothetical protein
MNYIHQKLRSSKGAVLTEIDAVPEEDSMDLSAA